MFRENETKSNKKDKIQKYLNQKGFLPVKSNFKCPYLHSEDINIQKKVHTKNGRPKMAQWHLKSIRGNLGLFRGPILLIHLIILGPTYNKFHTSILMMANLCADSAQKLTSLRQHCWVFLIFINFALNWHLGAQGEIWSSSFLPPKSKESFSDN